MDSPKWLENDSDKISGSRDCVQLEEVEPGWRDWSEWTECSVTCGSGSISRARECITFGAENPDTACLDLDGDGDFQVQACTEIACKTGVEMVDAETDKATGAGVEDNLFLTRYVEAVTSNGEVINAEGATSDGYGAWRLTEEQYDYIIKHSNSQTRNGLTNSLIARVGSRDKKSRSRSPIELKLSESTSLALKTPKKLLSEILVEKNFVENFVKREKFEISGF